MGVGVHGTECMVSGNLDLPIFDPVQLGMHAIQTTKYCYTSLSEYLLFEAYSPLPLL